MTAARREMAFAPSGASPQEAEAEFVDRLRATEYRLLGALLARPPDAATLAAVARLGGDATPLGSAHRRLAEAAAGADVGSVSAEFFALFVGVGRGELLPYASFYLTGFLNERPLAAVRDDLARLGLEREARLFDPEDHIAILLDVMAALADRLVPVPAGAEHAFFDHHLAPWAERFFDDLAVSPSARFYRAVAELGRVFIGLEAQAFAMDG